MKERVLPRHFSRTIQCPSYYVTVLRSKTADSSTQDIFSQHRPPEQ